ncbi:protein phosphatase 2C domain-containing protein [Macrococcus bohemicus]|nr:protein phosphatase 2C domain-containing protein [Macrococcus bohemicus]
MLMNNYIWNGKDRNYVDEIHIETLVDLIIGHFGGNSTAGQYKNEDGCMVYSDKENDWEFSIIMDAHNSSESITLLQKYIHKNMKDISNILNTEIERLNQLSDWMFNLLNQDDFKFDCRKVTGETAVLFVVRKKNYLWWFSVGDCILHLFHNDLIEMGEYQQNHRSFYEWIGEVNTFDKAVPCYSCGIKELRKGKNIIFMTTDGLTECPNTEYDQPKNIYSIFESNELNDAVSYFLKDIESHKVRDSTTIITWSIDIEMSSTYASNQ